MRARRGAHARGQGWLTGGGLSGDFASCEVPGEVEIRAGTAGQTLDAVVLVHQVRTVDVRRVTAFEIGGEAQVLRDVAIRRQVRSALAHHLGLDLPASLDGAA